MIQRLPIKVVASAVPLAPHIHIGQVHQGELLIIATDIGDSIFFFLLQHKLQLHASQQMTTTIPKRSVGTP